MELNFPISLFFTPKYTKGFEFNTFSWTGDVKVVRMGNISFVIPEINSNYTDAIPVFNPERK